MPSAAATYSLLAGANPLEIVHHSDRGSQYVSEGYTADLKELGVQLSVGSTGNMADAHLHRMERNRGRAMRQSLLRLATVRHP